MFTEKIPPEELARNRFILFLIVLALVIIGGLVHDSSLHPSASASEPSFRWYGAGGGTVDRHSCRSLATTPTSSLSSDDQDKLRECRWLGLDLDGSN
jgi:hypothetical protein